MISYDLFLKEQKQLENLEEKLILVNKGARYGQVIFLSGGAASGKGFALKNFMQGENFKVRDVDEFKMQYLRYSKMTGKYPEIQDLDLKNPADVFKLHKFVSRTGIKDKTLIAMLTANKNSEVLPNIIFDVTMKDSHDLDTYIPMLRVAGYQPKNIHLVWVLTNYHIAVQNNLTRDRVVPEDIQLITHEGAALTMYDLIKGELPRGLDGAIKVILNNMDQTIVWTDQNNQPITTSRGNIVIKGFTYLTLKDEGKPLKTEAQIRNTVFEWMKDNVPKTTELRNLFGERGE